MEIKLFPTKLFMKYLFSLLIKRGVWLKKNMIPSNLVIDDTIVMKYKDCEFHISKEEISANKLRVFKIIPNNIFEFDVETLNMRLWTILLNTEYWKKDNEIYSSLNISINIQEEDDYIIFSTDNLSELLTIEELVEELGIDYIN